MKTPTENTATPQEPRDDGCMARLVRPSLFKTVKHRKLGECVINMECLAMQLRNPDPTSMFVEHDGDIKEVSRSMIIEP
jgi:hypothetical protein